MLWAILFSGAGFVTSAYAQNSSGLPNSYPHDYPGKPPGDFSPEWQDYYLVKDSLPNVSFPLPRSFAGNIGVNRADHPNDTLFFWAFENQNGSLTAAPGERADAPWAIWLNGGPGSSSIVGVLEEIGPLLVTDGGALQPNEYSWDKFVDYIFLDQPVGVGFATADSKGYVVNEDQMAEDFLGFLTNLVKVFPSLATRPLILTGHSYAGTYIPYIMKAIFSTTNPPVRLSRAAIGNGMLGTYDESQYSTAVAVIETFPQLIGYDTEVYEYFREQAHLCGFDFNFTYPQTGKFPAIFLNRTTGIPVGINSSDASSSDSQQVGSDAYRSSLRNARAGRSSLFSRSFVDAGDRDGVPHDDGHTGRLFLKRTSELEKRRAEWSDMLRLGGDGRSEGKKRRDLSGRANGTIDSWYGCYLTFEVLDYALNFSTPWKEAVQEPGDDSPLNAYNLPDARKPKPDLRGAATIFLNDHATRTSLHAPTSKNWSVYVPYPFNNTNDHPPEVLQLNGYGDPSFPPSTFLDELLANASAKNVPVIMYNGNDDSDVNRFANELAIQNTTFEKIQGFTGRPSTPFFDDDGSRIGIVRQERGLKYVLIEHAGHAVAHQAPKSAFILFRDFILGSKNTGLVRPDGSVVGGEDLSLFVGDTYAIPGQKGILYGGKSSTEFYSAPAEKIEAWNAYVAQHRRDTKPPSD